MKQRFTTADVSAATAEISAQVTQAFVQNIYSLNARTLLFKFANKTKLVVESGMRIHWTRYEMQAQASPSAFVMKLRKHLRSRRLTRVEQLGEDRAVLFTFAYGGDVEDPDRTFHLLFEFFAAGNIILLNGHFRIMSLFRIVTSLEDQRYVVGATFDMDRLRSSRHSPVTEATLRGILSPKANAVPKQEQREEPVAASSVRFGAVSATVSKKKTRKATLRKSLVQAFSHLGPDYVDWALAAARIQADIELAAIASGEVQIDQDALLHWLQRAADMAKARGGSGGTRAGFIVVAKDQHDGEKAFEDYIPFDWNTDLDEEHRRETITFETFNDAVDKFYSQIESQKQQLRARQHEDLAARRLAASNEEQNKRVSALQSKQAENVTMAQRIEDNLESVDEAIGAIDALLQQGTDWVDIERLVESEKRYANPVAEIICLPLKLANNTITLLLKAGAATDDESDDDADQSSMDNEDGGSSKNESKTRGALKIDVKLGKSAWANACDYYEKRRELAHKQTRTEAASDVALMSARRRIENDLRKMQKTEARPLRQARTPFWFEKFYWFISSDRYLVIAARDNEQADLMVQSYFAPGDRLVGADMDACLYAVVKNNDSSAPIPPATLAQAAMLSLATTRAWDAKIVTSAWWVEHVQVSKIAAYSQDMLPAGEFTIKGDKNFLPPSNLTFGLGVVFLQGDFEDAEGDDGSEDAKSDNEDEGSEHGDKKHDIEDDKVDSENPETDSEATSRIQGGLLAEEDRDLAEAAKEARVENDGIVADGKPNSSLDDVSGLREALADESDVRESAFGDDDMRSECGSAASRKANTKPPRGKKGKLKKMAKYADQDEEDRVMRLKLLGVINEKKEQERLEREQKAERARRAAAEKAARAQQKKQRLQAAAKAREAASRDPGRIATSARQLKVPFEAMSPTVPAAGVSYSYAMPMFAPYQALSKFQLKAKLLPGTLKKGKAVKTCTSAWLEQLGNSADAKAALNGIRDEEFFGCLAVGRIKVTIPKASDSAGSSKSTRNKYTNPKSKSYVDPALLD